MRHEREYVEKNTITAFKVLKIIGFVILGIGMAILFGFVVKWLWNALLPDLFGIKEISYWQGVGILILGRILFGGFGGSSSSKNNESPKGVIKQTIHDEIEDNFRKEYREKYADCYDSSMNESDVVEVSKVDSRQENTKNDDLYEQWWEQEGEKKFVEFMKEEKPE